jgi:hypothetical protein
MGVFDATQEEYVEIQVSVSHLNCRIEIDDVLQGGYLFVRYNLGILELNLFRNNN